MKKMAIFLAGLFLMSGAVYADSTPIRVEILSVDEPIDVGSNYSLQVQLTNTSESDLRIQYSCCKGGHPWRFEYPSVSVVGGTYDESCDFSPCREDFTLKPGDSRTVDLTIVMAQKPQEGEIGFEIGFDFQGEVYWSAPADVEITESLEGATFQDED